MDGGGTRTVTLSFTSTDGAARDANFQQNKDVLCFFTGPEGWIAGELGEGSTGNTLQVKLSGSDPAIVPYSSKIHKDYFETHSLSLETDLPVLLIKLNHQDDEEYSYYNFKNLKFNKIHLEVKVDKLKAVAVSNDFGPVDTSKPFQPFGPSPAKGNALIIGLKEVFQQKQIKYIKANAIWQDEDAKVYPTGSNGKKVKIEYLQAGSWCPYVSIKKGDETTEGDGNEVTLVNGSNTLLPDIFLFGEPCIKEEKIIDPYITDCNFEEQEFVDSSSVNGFIRIKLNEDFGQEEYEKQLLDCLGKNDQERTDCISKLPKKRPAGPFLTSLTIDYQTEYQKIIINPSEDTKSTQASFFHIAPFGCAEQRLPKTTSDASIHLLPQLAPSLKEKQGEKVDSIEAAEFYIGITDLKPPKTSPSFFK